MTDGVVEAPIGAHFTECVPDYGRDEAFQKEYAASAKDARRVGGVEGEVPRLRRPRRVPEGGRAVSHELSDLITRAEFCVVAVAECFRGDGEILANPIGTIPMIGGRLARASFEPDLVMTDGEALLVANAHARSASTDADKVVEAWNPYRTMFDVVWSGRRHVMMGATQIDRFGNQNFAVHRRSGDSRRRSCSASAARPATRSRTPRATGSRTTRRKVFVREGRRRVAASATTAPPRSATGCARFHELRRVVTNLGVLDFETPDHRMRLRSRAPRRDRRRGRRGHRLRARRRRRRARDAAPRPPTSSSSSARSSTRTSLRDQEVPSRDAPRAAHPRLRPVRRRVPDRADRAWAGSPGAAAHRRPRAAAGGLGILASATMTSTSCAAAIAAGEGSAPTTRSA